MQRIADKQRQIKNEQTYLQNSKNINLNINHTIANPYGYNRYNRYNRYNNPNYVNTRYYNNGLRYNNGFNSLNVRGLTIY